MSCYVSKAADGCRECFIKFHLFVIYLFVCWIFCYQTGLTPTANVKVVLDQLAMHWGLVPFKVVKLGCSKGYYILDINRILYYRYFTGQLLFYD